MIRIAISQAAFEAIARSLPFGTVSFENKTNQNGERLIWLEPRVVDRLKSLRGRGESYSQVILRLAEREPSGSHHRGIVAHLVQSLSGRLVLSAQFMKPRYDSDRTPSYVHSTPSKTSVAVTRRRGKPVA